MNELLARFAEVMREECAIHEELLRLSLAKREAVIEDSLSKLDAIVREEQMLIAKQRETEKNRMACVEKLCGLTGRPLEEITMLTFAELAPSVQGGVRDELRAMAEKLSETLNQLKKNNDINSKMIEGRLEYIQCMVSAASAIQESSVYSARGTETQRSGQTPRLYDKKV